MQIDFVLRKTDSLLRKASRFQELLIGYICAAISLVSTVLLVGFVYLVGWGNPQKNGAHDLFKTSTLVTLFVVFLIAFGFSVLAFRLIMQRGERLMSPMLLRIWGAFFAIASAAIVVDCIVNKRWAQILRVCNFLIGSTSMAVAAFALARKQKQKDAKKLNQKTHQ